MERSGLPEAVGGGALDGAVHAFVHHLVESGKVGEKFRPGN